MANIRCKVAAGFFAGLLFLCGNLVQADDETLKKELEAARKRIAELEASNKKLTLQLEEARKQLLQAQNAEKQARKEAQAQAKKFEERLAKLAEERFGAPEHPPLPRPEPPVLPSDLRGKVTDVAGHMVTINIGIDAGLRVGTELDVYRPAGEKRLGTIKATDAFNLYPKQAVVKFTPARKVALKDLKPDELPRKGDVVRPMKKKD